MGDIVSDSICYGAEVESGHVGVGLRELAFITRRECRGAIGCLGLRDSRIGWLCSLGLRERGVIIDAGRWWRSDEEGDC